jgi:hypothetical protein
LLILIVLAAACSSSSSGTSTGSGGAAAGSTGAAGNGANDCLSGPDMGGDGGTVGQQKVGTAGGRLSAVGIVLSIPAGALAGDTTLTVAATAPPAGYKVASLATYHFCPAGTTFSMPVTVQMQLGGWAPAGAHLFWSNTSNGYDDLGGTLNGNTLTGMVTHFSTGFAGVPSAIDGGASDAPTDLGSAQ